MSEITDEMIEKYLSPVIDDVYKACKVEYHFTEFIKKERKKAMKQIVLQIRKMHKDLDMQAIEPQKEKEFAKKIREEMLQVVEQKAIEREEERKKKQALWS